jgi:class 3 adenylate cyclase/tetratricopeptide (TPR) repeat protein/ABC-type transport system involved in cytochrome c biogenesis ATPase subunit
VTCPACGLTNSGDVGGCVQCGATLADLCASCGSRNPPTSNFCGQCGHRLRPAADDATLPAGLREDSDEALSTRAERRQISVMFCDLVGSTALAEDFDPEDLTEIIVAYRDAVHSIVNDLGGYIARYLGDGLLIYFGYPQAHEDDTVRAVRAALRIIQDVNALGAHRGLPLKSPLQVHIGIHTGLVVVGELGTGTARERDGIIGETPNVAARLEQLAAPDSVLISAATYELVAPHFRCTRIAPRRLKGVSKKITSYRVEAETEKFGALRPHIRDAGRLVDRTEEFRLLSEGWRRAERGRGGIFVLSGEPGVGKSRLIRALIGKVTAEKSRVLNCYCSSENASSTFVPIANMLRHEFGFGRSEVQFDDFRRLAAAVESSGLASEAIPALAAFLSLKLPQGVQRPLLSPEGLRQKTMEWLLIWLSSQAEHGPVLFVVEDIHWADASTLEWLEQVARHIAMARIMIVLTTRSDFRHPFTGASQATEITLERLGQEHLTELLGVLTEGRGFPPDLRDSIIDRSDGIPLFLEEQVKTVYETMPQNEIDGASDQETRQSFHIPTSLRGLLAARLDRLKIGKTIAQIAAVIGREFSYDILAAIVPFLRDQLLQGLDELMRSEILYATESGPSSTYSFKHSLLHEAAYQTLLRAKRKQYHRQIALAYLKDTQIVETRPEAVAHHFEMAGLPHDSANYWYIAGRRARAQSAYLEAAAHFRKALQQIEALAPSPDRLKEEIRSTVALGSTLIATRGFAAPEVRAIYSRANELCERGGNTRELMSSLGGLLTYYQVHGPLSEALTLARRILELAKDTAERHLLSEAHRRLGWCRFSLGEMRAGHDHLTQAVELYEPTRVRLYVDLINSDPGVIGLINLAWVEGFIGDLDRSAEYAVRARRLARELGHPPSLAYALAMSAVVCQCFEDVDATFEFAAETIELATKNALAYWLAWATILKGWAIARKGQPGTGLETMLKGLRAYEETGAQIFKPHALTLIADVHRSIGQYREGLAYIDEAATNAERGGIGFYDAEILRVRGGLLVGMGDIENARQSYQQALEIAATQGAETLRRRAESSLKSLPDPTLATGTS